MFAYSLILACHELQVKGESGQACIMSLQAVALSTWKSRKLTFTLV